MYTLALLFAITLCYVVCGYIVFNSHTVLWIAEPHHCLSFRYTSCYRTPLTNILVYGTVRHDIDLQTITSHHSSRCLDLGKDSYSFTLACRVKFVRVVVDGDSGVKTEWMSVDVFHVRCQTSLTNDEVDEQIEPLT